MDFPHHADAVAATLICTGLDSVQGKKLLVAAPAAGGQSRRRMDEAGAPDAP